VLLQRPTLTTHATPVPGSRSRLLLLFACLATAAASITVPGQQPHRTELAAVAVLAALLLLRRHHQDPAAHPDSSDHPAGLERTETEPPDTEPLTEPPGPAHDAAADQLAALQAPARRLLQTRRSHARALALAQLTHTLATQQHQLAEQRREQTATKLVARDRLTHLENRLADLEDRADEHEEALHAIRDEHTQQLNRLHQSLSRHTDALHQLEHTLDP
jgi:hypothetical protein